MQSWDGGGKLKVVSSVGRLAQLRWYEQRQDLDASQYQESFDAVTIFLCLVSKN